MNCDDLLRLLAEYEDGLADQCLCAEIDRHLAACTHCHQLREDLERVSRLCRQSQPVRLPDDLRARITAWLDGGEPSDTGTEAIRS